MRSSKQIALGALALVLISGCAQQGANQKAVEDQQGKVLMAYRLIDQGRSEEAINMIEQELDTDPHRKEYRIILASAYAHEAGVKVQTLWPAAEKIIAMSKKVKLPAPSATKRKELSEQQVNGWILNLFSLSNSLTKAFDAYDDLVTVDEDKQALLEQGIEEIGKSEADLNKGDITYRALLRAVLIKSVISHQLSRPFTKAGAGQSCELDLQAIQGQSTKIGHMTSSLFVDLASVIPEDKALWTRRAEDLSKSVEVLTIGTSSLILVDEVTRALDGRDIFSGMFGQWIRCP